MAPSVFGAGMGMATEPTVSTGHHCTGVPLHRSRVVNRLISLTHESHPRTGSRHLDSLILSRRGLSSFLTELPRSMISVQAPLLRCLACERRYSRSAAVRAWPRTRLLSDADYGILDRRGCGSYPPRAIWVVWDVWVVWVVWVV
jgi:hypothetical protein